MPASYTIRRSVPRNTRRSKPASTPSICFPSFSINLFMAFPLPRGDLSSNTTNIIREQETPSPFGCGYAALCIRVVLPDADRSHLATRRLIQPTIKPKAVVVHSEFRSLLLPATRLVARRDSHNYAEKIKSGLSPAPTSHPPVPNPSASTRHNPALGIRPLGLNRFAVFM